MTNPKNLAAKHSAGLDLAGLGDLASMLDAPVGSAGQPQMFDVAKIREDPNNVRSEDNPGFGQLSMEELTESVKDRGIKSPLSLRSDPDRPGSYIINYGHRRFRAAKGAGKDQVPGFIDENFTSFDQVKENLDHERLTARELAKYIGARLAEGMSQAEIAAKLHRSKAFISQHVALLNLPDPVAEAFDAGHVQDLTVANELARAHKENPEIVERLLAAQEDLAAKPVTRADAKALRKPAKKATPKAKERSGDMRRMELALSDRLATSVQIVPGRRGGHVQLMIDAHNWDHFNDLLKRLGMGELVE
ncbi:ParB/RepB/Spo0J family partition protein [Pusillimonas caeni]|uniref:ParB/RepB/Spo0J family partition protein n=1 Tax=Pusillimonas caeni TaxID=1348472 RepID=UPI000E59CD7F|nr:ParB/RepB/Spo0J family partition protein [Pusillimonas caeni]TFL14030.1 ParB/RepB/Spo0J family partition protein [Pusillimonas caeni]